MLRTTGVRLPRIGIPILLVTLALIAAAGPGRAEPGVTLHLLEGRIAVSGYDPVAYFTEGAPVPGLRAYEHESGGAVYRFASEENRRRFAADPQRYKPAYGGFCAYGVRTGRKFPTDPTAWRIVDGRLYLLLNPATKAIWDLELENNIEIADAIWPQIVPYTDTELVSRTP